MTTEHLPVPLSDKTPGTALAVIAPKPTVSAEEIAWAKRQALGVSGNVKLLGALFGVCGGGLSALFIAPLAIATHGAAIPVMMALGSLGTAGGTALWATRTIRKGNIILDQSCADARCQAKHAEECGERALRDAIERGVVLKPYTELPVQVDTDVWKVLRIEGLSPGTMCDGEGRFSYSSIGVRAEMHDAERGADGTLVRKARTVYLCGDGEPHETYSIYGQITLKAPVALMPTGSALLPAPAPAPEADAVPKDILAPPPREVAKPFAPPPHKPGAP